MGLEGPASRLDALSQITSDLAYIDSTLLTFCLRLRGISKVWWYFIRIRGCLRAVNHVPRAVDSKHPTQRDHLPSTRTLRAHQEWTQTLNHYTPWALTTKLLCYRRRRASGASNKKDLSTIDNAYLRACVVNLSYSTAILRQFDGRFHNSSTPRHFGEINIFGLQGCYCQADYSMLFLQHYCWSLSMHGVVMYSNRDFSDQSCTALESYTLAPPDSARVWGRPIHDSKVDRRPGHGNCGLLFKLSSSFSFFGFAPSRRSDPPTSDRGVPSWITNTYENACMGAPY